MSKRREESFKQFEERLYEAAVKANPNNIEALRALGYIYTRNRLHDKALEIDKRLVSLRPDDAISHYNLACSCANLGLTKEALDALELSVLLGYSDVQHMEKDPDLNNIRNENRYHTIMARLKHHSSKES
jgi:tetratricopeptide (TPR) repeat protein